MTASGRRIALSAHIDVEWLEHRTAQALCPNCGVQGAVAQVLDIDYRPPVEHDDEHRFILQICPACAARFVDNMKMMEFHSEQQVERGENAFHVQLGAGLWPIAGQLARLDRPAGAKVLEIGGAYGFGLDFCLRARGWDGVGYDPSPFAAVGMRELGLPLRQEYFTLRHLELGPWDVAVATELLEHISYPAAFLLMMRKALGPDGVLMLSTPNAACIGPEQPVSNLLPLLSPGSHTVLQTKQSLELALHAAGFGHTHIIEDGLSLIAYASGVPIRLLEDEPARRAMYRHYLVERAGLAELTSDLRFGFAGRGIFEAVNDGDWAAADAAWDALLPAAQARFGLDLEHMTALPDGAATASLAELAKLMPLGLGMILFGRAMRLFKAGQSRAAVQPKLRLALDSVNVLLTALAAHSLQDALAASMAGLLRVELLICGAAAGRPEVVAGLRMLGDEETSWRGFMELVNAGAIDAAAALRAALPAMPGPDLSAGLRRDALLSLVNFHLAPNGDALLVPGLLQGLEIDTVTRTGLLLNAFTALVNTGRHDEAEAYAAAEPAMRNLDGQQSEAAEAARWAQLALDLQRGRALQAARKAARQERGREGGGDAAKLAGIFVEGFVRLMNAGEYAAARELALDEGMTRRLGLCPPALRHDALAGLLVLEAQPGIGAPEAVPARLRAVQEADMEELRAVELGFFALSMLVNQAAFAPARQLMPMIDPALIKLRPPFSPPARDALFAAGILYLQHKDDCRRAAASFARLRDALVKQTPQGQAPDPLFWPGLRGEVVALHQLHRGAEAVSLLQSFINAYPDAPEDLREQLKGVKS